MNDCDDVTVEEIAKVLLKRLETDGLLELLHFKGWRMVDGDDEYEIRWPEKRLWCEVTYNKVIDISLVLIHPRSIDDIHHSIFKHTEMDQVSQCLKGILL
jgi:hypothetical protein